MKIDSKKLLSFLKKVTINGNIVDCLLKFEPEGLKVAVISEDKAGAVSGLLPVKYFSGYAPMTATIKDVNTFMSFIKDMPGPIDISVAEKKLIVATDSKDVQFPMASPEFLLCNLPEFPVLEHDSGCMIDSNVLVNAKKDAERLKTKVVKVAVKDGQLFVTAGEDGFIKSNNKVPVEYHDVEAFYGKMFLSVVDVLEGQVAMAFDSDYPMLFTYRSDDGDMIKWLISPAELKDQT
jgi:hypothetical protein